MNFKVSKELYERASKILVGGVNSPVRAFKAVGGHPFFVKSGSGATITDVDGNTFIDYVLSWGPLILGHAHPNVVEAVNDALKKGSSFGIPTEAEICLAEKIQRHFPSMEKIRLVNSGTEAAMSALRLARGYTGRNTIVKVEGCYHGHVDALLVKAGSGLTTFGVPTSPGIPAEHARATLTIPYNNIEAAQMVIESAPEDIACVIVEPVPGNMGVVLPQEGYLGELRRLTQKYGILLIFDEVMSGFRVALGGAQERYSVTPDITILGKVIGGGLPIGAYGGRASIMDMVSPIGPVYQAGTLSGNPLATAAGIATLSVLETQNTFDGICKRMKQLCDGLVEAMDNAGVPVYGVQAGTMGCLFFHEGPVRNYAEALESDTARYASFFWKMLEQGVYFAPAQFEATFMSLAHSETDIDRTLEAAHKTASELV